MSAIQPFMYGQCEVRTIEVNGEPWFVLADVCKILGLTNPTMVASNIDSDDLSSTEVIDSLGRTQTARSVNESGLYTVVFLSRKPEAKDFQRWVTKVVLPTIRKTGSYSINEVTRADLARMVLESEAHLEAANQKVAELSPLADSYRRFLDADGTLPMGAVAQILGIGRQTLFDWMRFCNVMQRDRRPYANYQSWFAVKATSFERSSGASGVGYTAQLRPEGLEPLRVLLIRRGFLTSSGVRAVA